MARPVKFPFIGQPILIIVYSLKLYNFSHKLKQEKSATPFISPTIYSY